MQIDKRCLDAAIQFFTSEGGFEALCKSQCVHLPSAERTEMLDRVYHKTADDNTMHVMMSVSTSVVIPIWYLAVLIIFEPVWSKHATCYFVNSDSDGYNIIDKACREAELPDEYASSERKCQKKIGKKKCFNWPLIYSHVNEIQAGRYQIPSECHGMEGCVKAYNTFKSLYKDHVEGADYMLLKLNIHDPSTDEEVLGQNVGGFARPVYWDGISRHLGFGYDSDDMDTEEGSSSDEQDGSESEDSDMEEEEEEEDLDSDENEESSSNGSEDEEEEDEEEEDEETNNNEMNINRSNGVRLQSGECFFESMLMSRCGLIIIINL